MHGALDLMEAVIRDCPDELWHANLWKVPRHAIEVRDADGTLVTDPAEQHAIAEWQGQLWGVAWHALEVFEANLTAYFVPWKPWAGFTAANAPPTRSVMGKVSHVVEHATQVRQFIDWTVSGPIPDPTIHSPTEGRWASP